MLLVSIYFLSNFRLNLEKTKGFSAPTPLAKNEQKHLPKAARKRNLASITNMCYLGCRAISSTLSMYYYSWVFLQQSLLQTFGKTQL